MHTQPAITDLVPHRPPFLFIDDIVELSNERIETTWHADPQAPFFQGHYPGNPVMPGVLISECVFQAGAALMAFRLGDAAQAGTPVITRIRDAKFKRIVVPGETLRIGVDFDEELGDAVFLTGRVHVEEQLAVRLSFAAMVVSPERRA